MGKDMADAEGAGARGADRVELTSAAVLSLAALMTAWAGYQAALWDGEQAAQYSRAEMLRVQGSQRAVEGSTRLAVEAQFFSQWLNARAVDNLALADFYRSRFPQDMKPAFDAWLAERPFSNPLAPPTPFDMPAYKRSDRMASAELNQQADAAFEAGERANDTSDGFTEGITILAMSLFFGGIGQIFTGRRARIALLSIAVLALLLGSWRVMMLPTLLPG